MPKWSISWISYVRLCLCVYTLSLKLWCGSSIKWSTRVCAASGCDKYTIIVYDTIRTNFTSMHPLLTSFNVLWSILRWFMAFISYLLQPWFQSNQIHTLYFVYMHLSGSRLNIKNNHLNLKSTCNRTYESHFILNARITHWNDTLFHLVSFFLHCEC